MHSENKHIYCTLLISYKLLLIYMCVCVCVCAFHNTLVSHNMNLLYNLKVKYLIIFVIYFII